MKLAILFAIFLANSALSVGGQENGATQAANKKLVLDFYADFYAKRNVDAADKYISADKYIQHSAFMADGREGFKTAARGWFKDRGDIKDEVKRIAADGDLVWTHRRAVWSDKEISIVDIYRVEKGLFVEHWDIAEFVFHNMTNLNNNGVF